MGTSILQGNSQASAYSQQASIANQNAALANQQANQVQEDKQSQAAEIQERKRQEIGTARAGMAANGSDSGYGTGLGVVQDIAYGAQKDLDNLEYNATVEQNNYLQQSRNYKNQASVLNSYASNAKTGGYLGAAASYASSLTPYKSTGSTAGKSFDYSSLTTTSGFKPYSFLKNNYDWSKKWGY